MRTPTALLIASLVFWATPAVAQQTASPVSAVARADAAWDDDRWADATDAYKIVRAADRRASRPPRAWAGA